MRNPSLLAALFREFAEIAETIAGVPAKLCITVSRVIGRRPSPVTVTIQPISLLDTEKVELSVTPRHKSGPLKGHIDTAAIVTWNTSDPTQVQIDVETEPFTMSDPLNNDEQVNCPGSFHCWALTPLDTGDADISASAPGYETSMIHVHYDVGQPGQLNLSAGSPVPD